MADLSRLGRTAQPLGEQLRYLQTTIRWVEERHYAEFALLLSEQKPVIRIPVTSSEEHQLLVAFCERHALHCTQSHKKTVVVFENDLGEQYVTWADLDDPRPGTSIAYCAPDRIDAIEAEHAEREEDAEALGVLLGYPTCCVAAYERMAEDGVWIERLLSDLPAGPLPWESNKLAYALYGASLFPDYFPCSLACAGTVRLTRLAVEAMVRFELDHVITAHKEFMRRPIVVIGDRMVGIPSDDIHGGWLSALQSKLARQPEVRIDRSRGDGAWVNETSPRVLTFT